jgi:DNA-binding NtrC family response regulator
MVMNTVSVAAEKAGQSFAPSEAVSLLIGSTVGEVERALVVQTLACCDGNRTRAARMLGLSIRTLRNKIRLYSAEGIEVPAHTEVPALPARLEATNVKAAGHRASSADLR